MINNNNSLVVATFKDINGEIIKTMSFNKNSNFHENIIPDTATSYYLYSKKEDGRYSKDVSCQIGINLKNVINQNRENKLLIEFFTNIGENCAYAEIDGNKYVIPIEDNVKLVSNYSEFLSSFENDLETIKTSDKTIGKKM